LTVLSAGKVKFLGYNFHKEPGQYKMREKRLYIDKILSLVSQCFNNYPIYSFETDIGEWKLLIIDHAGNEHQPKGSLYGGLTVGNVDLTEAVCKCIPIENLYVFGDSDVDGNE